MFSVVGKYLTNYLVAEDEEGTEDLQLSSYLLIIAHFISAVQKYVLIKDCFCFFMLQINQ